MLVLPKRGNFNLKERKAVTTSYYSTRWNEMAECEVHHYIILLFALNKRRSNNLDDYKFEVYVLQ